MVGCVSTLSKAPPSLFSSGRDDFAEKKALFDAFGGDRLDALFTLSRKEMTNQKKAHKLARKKAADPQQHAEQSACAVQSAPNTQKISNGNPRSDPEVLSALKKGHREAF